MRAKRRYGYLAVILALLCTMSFMTFADEPSLIKVGLISVYNNASSITLSSDNSMMIGHYDESGFTRIGTLPSDKVIISKASSQYYDSGNIYYSYLDAVSAAKEGIVAYIEDGLFAVYTRENNGNPVSSSTTRYSVTDSSGNEIFIFNKANRALVFRGYDSQSGLNLTTVGTSKKYRGAIGIGGTTGITPYNILDIEEYLYGVIPGEMSPSWPEEALKAQAVAARSIAIYQYNRYISSGYNVVDTTATQVYGGYTKEDSRTNAAVDATQGQTIQYNGKVAEALYFSTSGGTTEDALNVWGNSISYLVGVSDRYETEPAQAAWSRNITMSEVNNCLTSQGVNIGNAQGIQIVSRTASGRVKEMKILGSSGTHTLTLEKIRTFFSSTREGSLKSRLFSFSNEIGDNTGSGTASTQKVMVLSANGSTETEINHLTASDGNISTSLGTSVAVQSASGKTTLTADTQQTGSSLQNEIIWGDFTIYGKGFGHGVGMSQSGAKGMAKAGFDYISILKYYYTGITVE